jgi:hypothetical protein
MIQGYNTAQYGIRVQSLGKLTLENVTIDGFTGHGISIENGSSTFSLVVKNTAIRNNAVCGINVVPNNALATVFVTDSLFAGNGVGYYQSGGTTGILQSSTFTGSVTGIQVNSSTSILALKGCQITHNTTGIQALSNAMIRIGANIITGNGTGLTGTDIKTWNENYVDGNTLNGTNSGTASAQ